MPEQATIQYRTNHATFDLPAQFKDKTMHIFTLNDSGPSDFSVVISHADAQPDESLADFSERLVQEMQASLPRFTLTHTLDRVIDGTAALELRYSWRRDGHMLHQRQLVALVPGAAAGTVQAMMIGATCMRAFTSEWNAAFDGMLETISLRHAAAATAPAKTEAVLAPPKGVFALSERRRLLRVFADQEEACRRTDAQEVEDDAWQFFDAAGTALQARFVIPNSGTMWFKAGTYVLDPRPHGMPLWQCLHHATEFVPDPRALPLASIAEVRDYLDQKRRS